MCDEMKRNCCCCHGPQGQQGVIGPQGPQGIQGIPGADGKQGPVGPQGPQGNTGAMGPQGQSGPQGQTGQTGQSGPQGPAGPSGNDGSMGPPGPQGPQGVIGPMGPQGIQGVPGQKCDDCGCVRYANLYSNIPQVVGAYSSSTDTVLLGLANSVSAGDFDLSLAGSTGDVKFLKHGIYQISWALQARIVPPVPNPVPSWSFGFWLNGSLVSGSVFSGYTQAPGDDACHSTADVIIEVKAGDLLRLRNTSVSAVNLNPAITGSVFPITIASVIIACMKELP